jgi:hypothetical protein
MITIDKKHPASNVCKAMAAILKTAAEHHRHILSDEFKLMVTDTKRMLVIDKDTFRLGVPSGFYRLIKTGSDYMFVPVVDDSLRVLDYRRIIPANNTVVTTLQHETFNTWVCDVLHTAPVKTYLDLEFLRVWFDLPAESSTVSFSPGESCKNCPVLFTNAGLEYVVMPIGW